MPNGESLNMLIAREKEALNEILDDYKDKKILLTGDASVKTESLLLEKYDLEEIDILKDSFSLSSIYSSNGSFDDSLNDGLYEYIL